MIKIGNINRLEILEITKTGAFLEGGEEGEIWLEGRDLPSHACAGDRLEVFVYYDSEDSLVATTKLPYAQVGEFARLEVTSIQPVGAFLDWGLPKDLFLPFREQTRELSEGKWATVFLYLDKSQRISASMRIEKYIDRDTEDYREGQRVDLFIFSRTDMGFKAIINGRHLGVLYENEVFQPLRNGQRIQGFIRKIREDGKIDLSLQQTGHKDAEEIGQKILRLLEEKNGFLPVGDKSSAEVIYDLFGVSKKKYKMALGSLYKEHLITIEEDGIRLTDRFYKGP